MFLHKKVIVIISLIAINFTVASAGQVNFDALMKDQIKKNEYNVESVCEKFFDKWSEEAHNGNIDAQFLTARCYMFGYAVKKDLAKSIKLLEISSDKGHVPSQRSLAYCYLEGFGTKQNLPKAISLYQKAADQNDTSAEYNLGYCYAKGRGVDIDYAKAIELYRRAASKNHSTALNNLGWCYEKGLGVEVNMFKAVEFYRKAIAHDSVLAITNLAWCYERGLGVEKDYEIAFKFYKSASEKGADRFNTNPNVGTLKGVYNLGRCYQRGIGVQKDIDKAIGYYKKAAAKNYAPAIFNLGITYHFAIGKPRDYKKAAGYYKVAVKLKHKDAMNNLGWLYEAGEGIDKDINKAIELYRMSAELGSGWGAFNLAEKYHQGFGVSKDINRAHYWYTKSAERGVSKARIYSENREILEYQTSNSLYDKFFVNEGLGKGRFVSGDFVINGNNEQDLREGEIIGWKKLKGDWVKGGGKPKAHNGQSYFMVKEGSYGELSQVVDLSMFKGGDDLFLYLSTYQQTNIAGGTVRLKLEVLDDQGELLNVHDSGKKHYKYKWFRNNVVLSMPKEVEKARITLISEREEDLGGGGYFDNVSLKVLSIN